MRSPRDFFKPLAAGAPETVREIPFRPSRVIHFFPPHNEKVVAKLPETVPTVDILLGNLEDAIPADSKEEARRGFIEMARQTDFGATVEALKSHCPRIEHYISLNEPHPAAEMTSNRRREPTGG